MLGHDEREAYHGVDEWFDLIHPDDREILRERLKTLEDAPSTDFRLQHRIRRNDGEFKAAIRQKFPGWSRCWSVRRSVWAVRVGVCVGFSVVARLHQASWQGAEKVVLGGYADVGVPHPG
jgi:hypothetical protein